MTAAERAQRDVKVSFEALLTGWSGALLSSDNLETRRKAREASAAARRAMAQGATPYEALVAHVAPALRTTADADLEAA